MKYAADLASRIWEALGFVLRLIHTDYEKYYIARHWKNWPEGASSMRGHPSPTHWRNIGGRGGWVPRALGPDAYEFLKTPSHRLGRSQYCGIVWVKEEGSWRDLEICASPKVWGAETSFRPPPAWKGGGRASPCPPCSYAYDFKSGVLPLSLSNYYIICTVVGWAGPIKPSKCKHHMVEARDFNQDHPLCFNNDLMNLNLYHVVSDVNSIDEDWKLWAELTCSGCNEQTYPIKRIPREEQD